MDRTRADAALIASKPEAAGPDRSAEVRKLVGQTVGNVFYGTLLRQMHASTIKGPYLHGGRGEEVFQGQLAVELGRRMGQAPGEPITEKLMQAIRKLPAYRLKESGTVSTGPVGRDRR
jgi:hypothetical protein